LIEGFINQTLDKTLWTHEAHQIVAIWFIMNYEPDDALCRIRSGIIAYNLSVGGVNTGMNGYHETITVFWWTLISLFIRKHQGLTFDEMSDTFLASRYTDRSIGFEYYTKQLLLSSAARARYFPPDIKAVAL
jgi:hypothetical protein